MLNIEDNDYETAIGIGGGHYAPRFTEIAQKYKVNIGHMIPEYAFRESDEDLIRIITESADKSGTKLAYIHRRSMKSDVAKRIVNAVASCGLEAISSEDLDIIEN